MRLIFASASATLILGLAGIAGTLHAADGDAWALLRSAEALQLRGHRVRALEQLESARALLDAGTDPSAAAAIHGALGKAYVFAGRRDEARASLQRALEASRGAGDAPVGAAALNDLGNLAAIEQRPGDAANAYGESIARSRAAGSWLAAVQAATNLARLRLSGADARAALVAITEAERDLARISDPRQRAPALLAIGDMLERLHAGSGDRRLLERAFRGYASAASLAESIGDLRALALARGGLARLYESDKRLGEALQLNQLALAAALAGEADDTVYRWHWQSGRVLAAAGRAEEAIAAYRRAEQAFQSIRGDLIQELRAMNLSYRDTAGPLYLEFADLLLTRARQTPQRPAAEKYLTDARDLVEQLKSVELEDYFRDECVARLQARRTAIDRVADDTAVIYPIFLKDRVEVLLSLPTGMRQVVLPVSATRLAGESHEFRRKLEKRSTHEYLPHAQRLYEWLFKPLEAELAAQRIDTVVLVPDGALRGIPLGALHDGKQFLVSRYAFATAPGLSLIEPKPLAQQAPSVLLVGLSEGVQDFPALPFVIEEIDALHRITGGKVMRDIDFRLKDLEREVARQSYTVVHIASHGHFDSDPEKSFLLTFEGKLSMNALERNMKLTRFREDPVELLTLSACRTAAGDERAALGLAGVAIKAGARSALATLWFINDQASSQLVVDFYEGLARPGTSKVKALQAAQQRMLADPRYRHPGYWSPFLLIGNWL